MKQKIIKIKNKNNNNEILRINDTIQKTKIAIIKANNLINELNFILNIKK